MQALHWNCGCQTQQAGRCAHWKSPSKRRRKVLQCVWRSGGGKSMVLGTTLQAVQMLDTPCDLNMDM